MQGPESALPSGPTVSEIIVSSLRIPYWAGCLIFAILLSPLAQFFVVLADTGSLERATALSVNTSFGTFQAGSVPTWLGATNAAIWLCTVFAVIYAPKLMRTRVRDAEAELLAIAPEGAGTLGRAFGGVSSKKAQLLLAAAFGLVSVPYTSVQLSLSTGAIYDIYTLANTLLLFLFFGSFTWVYFRSVWGLYRLGKEPLRLRPHYEDYMLGVKPIGSIALSLFLSYNLVIGLTTIGLLLTSDLFSLAALVVLALLGALMFILPLQGIHRKMLAEKQKERQGLLSQVIKLSEFNSGKVMGSLTSNCCLESSALKS